MGIQLTPLLPKLFLLVLTISICPHLSAQDWEQLNDPPFFSHHSNGFGLNGKAYVFEGVDYDSDAYGGSNKVWEYDPETDTWTRINDFPGDARGVAIGDDWDGKYYYGFGINENDVRLNDLWEFDPVTQSFTQLPSCPCLGRTHPALIAHNGKIFMGSGSSNQGDLNDWWIYDIQTQEWTAKPNIPTGSRHHPFFFSIDEYVFVGGGHVTNWLRYDPTQDDWDFIDNLPRGRVAGTQFSYNNKGYILAGDDRFHDHVPLNETFMRYDMQTAEWEFLPSFPLGSRWAPSSFVIDSIVYFFGGLPFTSNGFEVIQDSTMWKFDLSTLDVMTSNNNVAKESEIEVFPNPFQKQLNLSSTSLINEEVEIRIYNTQGQLVFAAETMVDQTLDLSHLANGVYFMLYQNDDEKAQSIRITKTD